MIMVGISQLEGTMVFCFRSFVFAFFPYSFCQITQGLTLKPKGSQVAKLLGLGIVENLEKQGGRYFLLQS